MHDSVAAEASLNLEELHVHASVILEVSHTLGRPLRAAFDWMCTA